MDFWEVVERLEQGEIIDEEAFDRDISKYAYKYKDKYNIKFNPDEPVQADPDMADRLFEAGLEFFLDVGVYCLDTRKVAKFTRDETMTGLENAPAAVVFGSGKDKQELRHRDIDDSLPPFCSPNAIGTPIREELFDAMLQSYAQIRHADTFSSPSLISLYGRKIGSGSPLEVEGAIHNARRIDAIRKKIGRPEMSSHNLIAVAGRSEPIMAAMQPEFGVNPTDGLLCGAIAEMKVDYDRLKKAVFCQQANRPIGALIGPLMGGYSGGPEGTAIVTIAHHFLGLMVFQAHWHDSFPFDIHQVCNTTRATLWVASMTGQALARNTHLPCMYSVFTASGPCTEMIFDELCANQMVAVAAGFNINPMAPARNKYPERATGFEADICCEIGHVIADTGPSLADMGDIVKRFLERYEKDIPNAPKGKTFPECYDVEKMKPKPEYFQLYEEAVERWAQLGFSEYRKAIN
jgi:methylamine--corrinoid protein Co-methyltransferase